MKTAMQELIELLNGMMDNGGDFDLFFTKSKAQELLKKEKQQIEKVAIDMVNIAISNIGNKQISMECEFEKTFNTTFKEIAENSERQDD